MCLVSEGNGEPGTGNGGSEAGIPLPRSPFPVPAIPLVHAVTDDLILTRRSFEREARAVMRALGERGALHLRARLLPAARILALAESLYPAQEETGCWLVVNDRVDIALAADARGAQLTSRSLAVADARAIAPGLALGASIHAPEEAAAAARAGADWVVAGHIFETGSHPGEPGRGPQLLAAARAAAPIPIVAIGGITPGHVAAVRALGAHGVAAISGIWGAEHPERAATDYLSAHDAHRASAG
jgi:thiamine-phosphate diphosphorylase